MGLDNILVAAISHETNTFSPVPTPLESFGPQGGPLHGDEAYLRFRGTGTAAGGLIELAESTGARVAVPIIARSLPGSALDDDAYRVITDRLCDSVRAATAAGRCDALFLELPATG
jgi:microcystin degradation protein MlrC